MVRRRVLPSFAVLLLAVVSPVVVAIPASACSCAEQEVSRAELLRRGGAFEGRVVSVSEPERRSGPPPSGEHAVDVQIAVDLAYGADPGPQLTLPAIAPVESTCGIGVRPGMAIRTFLDVGVLSSCSVVHGSFAAALSDPPPPSRLRPVRFLGPPSEPGSTVAGLDDAGAYITQVALPDAGPLVRCPGDQAAVVRHGGDVFTGEEDIRWSRLDLTTLAVEQLVDIAALNPDPTRLQNVFAGAVCLTPDGSDVLALFSWWEDPDEKPQRLVRVTDGAVLELAIAPIWQIWDHAGTVYARVGEAGTELVTVDPTTGATAPHGTLPAPGDLQVAGDGAWALLTDRGGPAARTVQDVRLVPEVAITATASTDGFVQPLVDGRTLVSLPPSAGGPLLRTLDEALQPEGAWPVGGAGTGLGVLAEDLDGAWLAEDGVLTRLDRGGAPVPTGIRADRVLPVAVTPALPLHLAPVRVVTYDHPATPGPDDEPPTTAPPASGPQPARQEGVAGGPGAAAPLLVVSGVLAALAVVGGLARRRR
jgi:hypothetical protein